MDAWHLTAAEYLASSCRSVLLALAVLHVRVPPAPASQSNVLATYESWLPLHLLLQCFGASFSPFLSFQMLHPLRPHSGA